MPLALALILAIAGTTYLLNHLQPSITAEPHQELIVAVCLAVGGSVMIILWEVSRLTAEFASASHTSK